jgi:hypothetical protein
MAGIRTMPNKSNLIMLYISCRKNIRLFSLNSDKANVEINYYA